MNLSEGEPLLASALLHLAWPKERQIAYLKEIGFHMFDDSKVPTDELMLEFHHAISTVRAGVERGGFSRENYEMLLTLETALIAIEDAPDLRVSRELESKPWRDIRLLASTIAKNLDLDIAA